MTDTLTTSVARYLPALRKATELIIKINPRTISLTPHTKVDKGGGVYDTEEDNPRAAQTFSVEPITAGEPSGEVPALSGAEVQRWWYYLVGRYDSDMEIGDTWEEGSTSYRIVSLNPKNDYEKRALVVAYGPDPNYGA